MGTAQTRANNKYKAKTYDRIEVIVPKGKKEEIKNFVETKGQSVNNFINIAIDEKIQREQNGSR